MSDQPQIKVLKKRGRKPKNKNAETLIIKSEEPVNSENEVIIAYLPINLNEPINSNNNDHSDDDIFIKSESFFTESKNTEDKIKQKMNLLNISSESDVKTSVIHNFNKININYIKFNENTKCWWCKHCFNTPNLSLPEYLHDNTFHCIGNFCSWECVKAYNIDLNDNFVWKRESLIDLMYQNTYGVFKNINPAPSWLILEDFGGYLSIKKFRENFELITTDYLVLHPPLISRQMQIEESYKKNVNSNVVVNKLDKLLLETNTLTLRRNKPIETSQINLEKSMGLKRKN
jgi:hypothetical protein